MSIVEKALSKLRKVEPFQPQAVPDTGKLLPVALPERDRQVLRPHLANAEPRVTARVQMDVDRLRQFGLVGPADGDNRRLADEIRRIKWALLKTMQAVRPQGSQLDNVIMVSSALPNEGKTFTSYNLAVSLAAEGDRPVWLIDADTIRRQLSRALQVDERPGLLDAVGSSDLELDDVLVATDAPRLFIVPSGGGVAVSAEMLSSGRISQLLTAATARYADLVVVFDTAPILATSVPQALAHVARHVLIAVNADQTSRAAVSEALAQLHRNDGVSLVLNQVSHFMRQHYYSGYYDDHAARS